MGKLKEILFIVGSALIAFLVLSKKSVISTVIDENSIRDKIKEEEIKKDLDELKIEEKSLKKEGVKDKSSKEELEYWENN